MFLKSNKELPFSHEVFNPLKLNINPFLNTPNTTIALFANTVDPDETAHNEPSHLNLQFLPSDYDTFYIESFSNFCRRNFVVCFVGDSNVGNTNTT